MGDAATEPGSAVAAISIAEALRLPCLEDAAVLAGGDGLHRDIRGVNIMEDAEIVRWMRGGELLLSTGYTVREDTDALEGLVAALAGRGLAGLAIKLGLYVDAVPAAARAAADELGFPIIGLPPEVMFNDILSEVLGTILNRQAVELERSRAIHARLTAVALEGGSFSELADAVAELLHRPVAIRDAQGRALAATADVPDDGDAAHVVRAIRVGDAEQGEIAVWTGGAEIDAHERMTMEHAATIAAMAIAQERAVVSSEQRHRTLLLMQLVTGRSADRAEVARWGAAMGWDLDAPHAVVLVELRDGDGDGPVAVAGSDLEARLVRAARDAIRSPAIVWALQSGLALLVEPGPGVGPLCRAVHAALHRARPQLRVMIGAGGVADGVDGLSRSYEEAGSALALGRELRGDDFVLEHEELGVYRLLSRLPTAELRRQRDDAIGPLLEYDAAHGGALVRTLEAFLACERNRVKAAEELFVHYNTLRYRLGQIDKLTGGLSGDTTSRLNVELALCAHRLLQGRQEA
jgi:PucR family transcriptional regulator, purine catabolism regulatory protein